MLQWITNLLPQNPRMDVGSEWTLNGRTYYVAIEYDNATQLEYWRVHRFTPCYALQALDETDDSTDDNLIVDKRGRVARVRMPWNLALPRYEDTGLRFRDMKPL